MTVYKIAGHYSENGSHRTSGVGFKNSYVAVVKISNDQTRPRRLNGVLSLEDKSRQFPRQARANNSLIIGRPRQPNATERTKRSRGDFQPTYSTLGKSS